MSEQDQQPGPGAPDPHADEVLALRRQHEALVEANEREIATIGHMGAQLDPAVISGVRINAFIDFMFQRLANPESRDMLKLAFEVFFGQSLNSQLREIKGGIRKAQLASGGGMGAPPPGGLIQVPSFRPRGSRSHRRPSTG